MDNKILFGLICAFLILSGFGLYLPRDKASQLKTGVAELEERTRKLERAVQLLEQRTPPYIYTGEAVGYVIEFENKAKFYFAGATDLTADIELIGSFHKPDVVFLPIGNIYTMDPKKAAFAALLVPSAKYIVPSRYGSFPELVQKPDQFFAELKKYQSKARALEFKTGEQQEIMGVKAQWLGHGHWLFETPQGARILLDPAVQYNPDFPKQYQELIQLKKIDLVLITNGHFDSMTVSDLKKWGDLFNPIFIAPYELGIWLKSLIPNYKIIALGRGSRIGKPEMKKLGINQKTLDQLPELIISVVGAGHSSSATP